MGQKLVWQNNVLIIEIVSTSHLKTIYCQGGGCKGFWEMITWLSGGTERRSVITNRV